MVHMISAGMGFKVKIVNPFGLDLLLNAFSIGSILLVGALVRNHRSLVARIISDWKLYAPIVTICGLSCLMACFILQFSGKVVNTVNQVSSDSSND